MFIKPDLDDAKEQIRDAYKQQKFGKCIELINLIPKPVSAQYSILKASCLNNLSGKSQEAHQILHQVLKEDPENAYAYYGDGLVFVNEGRLSAALECFNMAIKLEPGEKMQKAREMKSRVEEMIKLVKKEPGHADFDHDKESKTCQICGKTFAKVFSRIRHMLLHSGIRPFKCALCEFGFIQRSDLNRHLATHSDIANFPCEICDKKFKTKKNLACHMTVHAHLKPFQCAYCPKRFGLLRFMRFHEKQHQKEFDCDVCGKTFDTQKGIRKHMKTHVKYQAKVLETKPIIKQAQVESEPIVQIKTEIAVGDGETVPDFLMGDVDEENLTFGDVVYKPLIDSDLEFLHSLVKDIKRMTQEQKKEFRKKTLETIKEVLSK